MTTQQSIENVVTKKPVKLPAALTNAMEVRQGFEVPDLDHLRIIVTGRASCGKTSLVASNPTCLMFDLERQPMTVIDAQCQYARIKASSSTAADDFRRAFTGFVDAYRADKGELRNAIRTVAIDSFDSVVDLFLRDLCRKNGLEDAGDYAGGHGKGYARVREEIFDMLDSAHRAGLGWVLIAHQSLKEVGTTQVPALNVSKSFRDHLIRSRDLMFKIDCVAKRVTRELKNGQKIEVNDPKQRQYVLITDTSTTAEDFDTPKVNVPMESGLIIPERGGWDALRKAYARAVEIRQQGTK